LESKSKPLWIIDIGFQPYSVTASSTGILWVATFT
jgi:hypothetical protein